MILIFKTNVECREDADSVLEKLSESYPDCKITFDLEDCDNILRIAGAGFTITAIMNHLLRLGYRCEELPY